MVPAIRIIREIDGLEPPVHAPAAATKERRESTRRRERGKKRRSKEHMSRRAALGRVMVVAGVALLPAACLSPEAIGEAVESFLEGTPQTTTGWRATCRAVTIC